MNVITVHRNRCIRYAKVSLLSLLHSPSVYFGWAIYRICAWDKILPTGKRYREPSTVVSSRSANTYKYGLRAVCVCVCVVWSYATQNHICKNAYSFVAFIFLCVCTAQEQPNWIFGCASTLFGSRQCNELLRSTLAPNTILNPNIRHDKMETVRCYPNVVVFASLLLPIH